MQVDSKRTVKHIRMNQDVYLQARVAALMAQKGVGEWVEEAVIAKLRQEPELLQGSQQIRIELTRGAK